VPECGAHQIIFRVSSAPPLALRRRLFGAAAFWTKVTASSHHSPELSTLTLLHSPCYSYYTHVRLLLLKLSNITASQSSNFSSRRPRLAPTAHHPPCHHGSARRTRERISIARNAPCSEVVASPPPPASPRLPRPPPRTLMLPRPQRPAAQTHTQTRTTTTIPTQHQASLHANPATFPSLPRTHSATSL